MTLLSTSFFFFFFFNDPAPPEFYPFSLPDAFPIFYQICVGAEQGLHRREQAGVVSHEGYQAANGEPPIDNEFPAVEKNDSDGRLTIGGLVALMAYQDRKSTRLKSSHLGISYAVFCF